MERFNALSRGSKVMLVAGVLLLIDTFFAWQQVEVEFGIEASQNGQPAMLEFITTKEKNYSTFRTGYH